ncbi:MAG: VIT1/CCC1 transporter family protein [Burkholderiales bacterium]
MNDLLGDEPAPVLDPIERISEILFGLIMAVTIVGAVSIATPGPDDIRTVTLAAFGCNLAWGLVDAVMFLVGIVTERNRHRVLAIRIRAAEPEVAHRLIRQAMPEYMGALVGADAIDAMRRRLAELPPVSHTFLWNLTSRDYQAALSVFWMVVVATFPVVLPFVLTSDATLAIRLSRVITLVMMFLAGYALGKYCGDAKPWIAGLTMAVLGVVLIAVVKALGG